MREPGASEVLMCGCTFKPASKTAALYGEDTDWGRDFVALEPIAAGEQIRTDLTAAQVEKATKVVPSSAQASNTATSGLRVQGEYSVCSAVMGCSAWARRRVSAPTSDRR